MSPAKTIGMELVACLSAATTGVVPPTITSGAGLTTSAKIRAAVVT